MYDTCRCSQSNPATFACLWCQETRCGCMWKEVTVKLWQDDRSLAMKCDSCSDCRLGDRCLMACVMPSESDPHVISVTRSYTPSEVLRSSWRELNDQSMSTRGSHRINGTWNEAICYCTEARYRTTSLAQSFSSVDYRWSASWQNNHLPQFLQITSRL